MRYFPASMFMATIAGLALVTTPAQAGPNDTACGVSALGSLALVECANPNDSPGPYAPPPVSIFLIQDNTGVTAELDNGTVIDIDTHADGSVDYAVDGADASVLDVADELDALLSVEEQAAMSDVLSFTSVSDGTNELIGLLGG